MKMSNLFLAVGFVLAATAAKAQTAPAPSDPLSDLQGAFGTIVGNAFHAPDKIAAATVPGAAATLAPPLGGVLRTSLQIPGAAFAAVFAPFDPDVGAAAAPVPPVSAPARRHTKTVHHRQSA